MERVRSMRPDVMRVQHLDTIDAVYDLILDMNALIDLLSGGPGGYSPARRVAARLYQMVHMGGTRTAVCEKNYFDEDHMRCHQRRYARSIRQPQALCKRLHFFGVAKEDFISNWSSYLTNGGLSPKDATNQLGYMGFVVIRDGLEQPLGRTVLSDKLVERAYKAHYRNKDIKIDLPSRIPCDVHLSGVKFSFEGTAQMPADIETGVCASAACWVVMRSLHGKRLARWYSLSEITDIANKRLTTGHVMPSGGLNAWQICNLFREAGLDSFFIPVDRLRKDAPEEDVKLHKALLKAKMHCLIEGGLPVIVMTETADKPEVPMSTEWTPQAHAVTLIGHTLEHKGDIEQLRIREATEGEKRFCSVSSRTRHFILHDSLIGPFELAEVTHYSEEEAEHVSLGLAIEEPFKPGGAEEATAKRYVIRAFIAPCPEEVCIHAWDANLKAVSIMNEFWRGSWGGGEAVPDPGEVVFRTILMTGTEFKEYLWDEETQAPKALIAKAADIPLPKWIYVTQMRDRNSESGWVDGQFVIDATTTSYMSSVLWIQYKGLFIGPLMNLANYSREAIERTRTTLPSCNNARCRAIPAKSGSS